MTRNTAFFSDLEAHLEKENPVLVEVVRRFRRLDRIAYAMGAMPKDKLYTMRISWWPLVSLLGTFSAGKSSFINYYLGQSLQRTGNQAVDDKFTVVSYGQDNQSHVLPGVSLDSDIRFPFYRMSEVIEKVAPGEGQRIDNYVQLKTCSSDKLRGKVLIDSPGFDADRQRDATLRITDHIIDLSDLVLVFFDARHPEPGAMRDTLRHLVSKVVAHPDSGKFVFILNQMDTTARENNPEEVVAAWLRALAEVGFSAAQFYTIYNPDACVAIEDPERRGQFEAKRDQNLQAIFARIEGVHVSRSYRTVGSLEKLAAQLSDTFAPRLTQAVASWRSLVLLLDVTVLILVVGIGYVVTNNMGYWDGWNFTVPWSEELFANRWVFWGVIGGAVLCALIAQAKIRRMAAGIIRRRLVEDGAKMVEAGDLAAAFDRSTSPLRSLLAKRPAGWSKRSAATTRQLIDGSNDLVQKLNDHYTNPAGND